MATRDEVKSIMYVIANEYNDFIPKNKKMTTLKVNTWFKMLEMYDYDVVQQATMQMLAMHTYGTPKVAHLMEIIKPKLENQNLGIEYAQRLIDLSSQLGTDNMANAVRKEFGDVGYSVFMQVKQELRELLIDNVPTFKAQVRSIFNSYNERYKNKTLTLLPYVTDVKKIESEM